MALPTSWICVIQAQDGCPKLGAACCYKAGRRQTSSLQLDTSDGKQNSPPRIPRAPEPRHTAAGVGLRKRGQGQQSRKKARNEAVRHFNTNGDGKFERDEAESARKSFAAEPNGPAKSLDADQNGQLEAVEITGVQG
jgi:hypothetical protein